MSVIDDAQDGKYGSRLVYPAVTHQECWAEKARLRDLFKAELLAEADLTDHPRGNLLFDLAWEQGHANGYHEVVMCFGAMEGLLK